MKLAARRFEGGGTETGGLGAGIAEGIIERALRRGDLDAQGGGDRWDR